MAASDVTRGDGIESGGAVGGRAIARSAERPTVGYLSGGIAKSGVRDPYYAERGNGNPDH